MKKFFTLLAVAMLAGMNTANAATVKAWFSEWYGNGWTATYEAEFTYDADEDEYCINYGGIPVYFSVDFEDDENKGTIYFNNVEGGYVKNPEDWTNAQISFTKDDSDEVVELFMSSITEGFVHTGYDEAEYGGEWKLEFTMNGYTEYGWWDWAKWYAYVNPEARQSAAVKATAAEADNSAYDLMGRKVNAEKLHNGIYIINGMKTLVK